MHCSNEYVWHGWNRMQISLSNNTSLWPKDNLKQSCSKMILYATPRLHKLWLQLVQLWKEVGERKREKEKKREGETEILDCGQMIRGFHEECAANRILSSTKTRILRLMNSCSVYFLLLIYGQNMSAQKTTCIFQCFPQDCVRIVVACDVTLICIFMKSMRHVCVQTSFGTSDLLYSMKYHVL